MASQEIRELTRTIPFEMVESTPGLDYRILNWIGSAGSQAPEYWSRSRDIWLRQFYLKSDYLKIAVRTFVQKAYAVPLTVAPRDHTIKAHAALAEQVETDIKRNSGILRGFLGEFAKFITDYCTQDNGAFMLVMGGGRADGPITGGVSGLVHLDSQRCNRTGNIEYPVIYEHTDGRRYKLHYTRVILMSAMPSADAEMFDVGLCAVSGCIDAAQDMLSIMGYTAEKLGSRPARQILYIEEGATLDQLNTAVLLANTKMDAQGLERFSRTMLLAPAKGSPTPLKLGLLDLSKAPDGFDREKATVMDVAVIAAAFGMDARDLAHSFGLAGQTKADAEVQNLKTYGKGVNQFLEDFAEQLNQKVLPDTLEAYFDYVDDTQDKQAADIGKVRAESRTADLNNGAITLRIAREQMLENGEISEEQFEQMELDDGRLADGLDVLMLFQSQDSEIRAILQPVTDNPFGQAGEDVINQQIMQAWARHDSAPNANIKRKMRQAVAALRALTKRNETPEPPTVQPTPLRQVQGKPRQTQMPGQPNDEQPATDDEPVKSRSLHTKQDDDLDAIMAEYGGELEDLIQRANDGEMSQDDFEREMEAVVAALLLAAFLRGSKMDEAELTLRLRAMVNDEIALNVDAVKRLADDVYAGRYSPDDLGDEGAASRILLWVGTLAGLYALGQLNRHDDPFYQWQVGPTEHCADCARLNGQVHTAREWLDSGWSPRSRGLACHGYRCQCSFVETSGPSQGGF